MRFEDKGSFFVLYSNWPNDSYHDGYGAVSYIDPKKISSILYAVHDKDKNEYYMSILVEGIWIPSEHIKGDEEIVKLIQYIEEKRK